MSSHTSGNELSDRLLDPLKDSLAKMFTTDYVQKILMTGEMSDENIRYAQNHWKRSREMAPAIIELMRRAYSVATDDNDRQILAPIVNTVDKGFTQFQTTFERQLGGIGADVKTQPMDAFITDYRIMFYREIKRGSLLRLIVTQLVGVWIVNGIHEYLLGEPRYRPNGLTDCYLYLAFDPKAMVNVYKSLIDPKGGHISTDEELELIQFAREVFDLEFKFYLNETC